LVRSMQYMDILVDSSQATARYRSTPVDVGVDSNKHTLLQPSDSPISLQ